jgi:GNAT superfamily N-acetyltransferase
MAIAAVRPAAAPDVDEIVRIQAVTWEAAYAELVPPAALARLRSPVARQAWTAAVQAGPGHHVFLATEGEWTVGFCAASFARHPDDARPPTLPDEESAAPEPSAQPPEDLRSAVPAPDGGPAGPRPSATIPDRSVQPPGGSTDGADGAEPPTIGAERWAEIGALLVEPRWGRRGHGGRLLATAAHALRNAGALYGLAWVPEADAASRRFYERLGWELDGTVRVLDTGDGELREIRLTGSLDLTLDP